MPKITVSSPQAAVAVGRLTLQAADAREAHDLCLPSGGSCFPCQFSNCMAEE
jgi:hypothetical protein